MPFFRKKSKRPIAIDVYAKTDVGKTREHNEDSYLVADLERGLSSLDRPVPHHQLGEAGSLFVVADGMGGAVAGEIASDMAVEQIYRHLATTWRSERPKTSDGFANRLQESVEQSNTLIHQRAVDEPELKGMGTTCTAVGVFGDFLYMTQVGDSRAYLIRNGTAKQLTKDQSLMQRLVDVGELTEEEAEKSERKNIILQALGPEPRVKVDLTYQQVRKGDLVLLCSDGLSGQMTAVEMADIATSEATLEAVCTKLIDLANERGGPDNITVIAARFSGDGLSAALDEDAVGHQQYPVGEEETTQEIEPIDPSQRNMLDVLRERWQLIFFLSAAIIALILILRSSRPA